MTHEASTRLAMDIIEYLGSKGDLDTTVALTGLSIALTTLAVEAGLDEEKAVYAFRKSYGNSKKRLNAITKGVH